MAPQPPLHVTASALIVHPETARVLLRWHERQQAWLQAGGHGDPGEETRWPSPAAKRQETGLADLVPWPDPHLRHLVIVGVPRARVEPAHEHADLRYFMATQTPEAARAENEHAPLRWLSLAEAYHATSESTSGKAGPARAPAPAGVRPEPWSFRFTTSIRFDGRRGSPTA